MNHVLIGKIACPQYDESCYWASPDRAYEHVATVPARRLDLVWQADEVEEFDHLLSHSDDVGIDVPIVAKRLIAQGLARLEK